MSFALNSIQKCKLKFCLAGKIGAARIHPLYVTDVSYSVCQGVLSCTILWWYIRALLLVYIFLHTYVWCTHCIALYVNMAGHRRIQHHIRVLQILCRLNSSVCRCIQVSASGRTKYNHIDRCPTSTNRSAIIYWL